MSWWRSRSPESAKAGDRPGVWRRAIAVVLAAACGGETVDALAAERAVVERIRYVGTVSYSRVVVDLSGPAKYEVLQVPGDGDTTPVNRLVVDFSEARIGPEAKDPLTVGDALLQRIRTGQYTAQTARVVLDFRQVAEHRVFTLHDPYRLVIDMRGPQAASARSGIRRLDSGGARPAPAAAPAKAGAPAPASAAGPAPELRRVSIPPPPAAGPAPAARPFRIMLDPGHGGKDPGARGVGGLYEKDVVLAISRALAEDLRAEEGVEVLLTRDDDRTLSLEERTALANAAEADLFVSVHANASARQATRGIEVYYLNNTNNRGTLRLAALENGLRWNPEDRGLQKDIPDLSYILSDLRQTYKVEESRVLADHLGGALVRRLRGTWDGIPEHAVREGPFYVLVGAYMPCVLVEVSYLTHPVEGKRLGDRAYRRALAAGLLDGIRSYMRETRMAKNL